MFNIPSMTQMYNTKRTERKDFCWTLQRAIIEKEKPTPNNQYINKIK